MYNRTLKRTSDLRYPPLPEFLKAGHRLAAYPDRCSVFPGKGIFDPTGYTDF